MKKKHRKRTNLDLLFYSIKCIGGPMGPLMLEQFKQEVLPNLKLNDWAHEEISKAEFHRQAELIRQQAPAFLWHLRYEHKGPPVPESWMAKQN